MKQKKSLQQKAQQTKSKAKAKSKSKQNNKHKNQNVEKYLRKKSKDIFKKQNKRLKKQIQKRLRKMKSERASLQSIEKINSFLWCLDSKNNSPRKKSKNKSVHYRSKFKNNSIIKRSQSKDKILKLNLDLSKVKHCRSQSLVEQRQTFLRKVQRYEDKLQEQIAYQKVKKETKHFISPNSPVSGQQLMNDKIKHVKINNFMEEEQSFKENINLKKCENQQDIKEQIKAKKKSKVRQIQLFRKLSKCKRLNILRPCSQITNKTSNVRISEQNPLEIPELSPSQISEINPLDTFRGPSDIKISPTKNKENRKIRVFNKVIEQEMKTPQDSKENMHQNIQKQIKQKAPKINVTKLLSKNTTKRKKEKSEKKQNSSVVQSAAKNIKNMSIESKMNIISKLLKKPKNAIESLYLKKSKSRQNTLNSKNIRLIDLSKKSNICNIKPAEHKKIFQINSQKRLHTNRGKQKRRFSSHKNKLKKSQSITNIFLGKKSSFMKLF